MVDRRRCLDRPGLSGDQRGPADRDQRFQSESHQGRRKGWVLQMRFWIALLLTIFVAPVPVCVMRQEVSLSKFSSCSVMSALKPQSDILVASSGCEMRSTTKSALSQRRLENFPFMLADLWGLIWQASSNAVFGTSRADRWLDALLAPGISGKHPLGLTTRCYNP
jgi:hypothetical protein